MRLLTSFAAILGSKIRAWAGIETPRQSVPQNLALAA